MGPTCDRKEGANANSGGADFGSPEPLLPCCALLLARPGLSWQQNLPGKYVPHVSYTVHVQELETSIS